MNSKNLSKAINRVLAILLTAAMVAGSFTVPVKATEPVIEETSEDAVLPEEEETAVAEEITEEVEKPVGVIVEDGTFKDRVSWISDEDEAALSKVYDGQPVLFKTNVIDKIKVYTDSTKEALDNTGDIEKTFSYQKSTDGGETWATLSVSNADADIKDAAKYRVYAVLKDKTTNEEITETIVFEITKAGISEWDFGTIGTSPTEGADGKITLEWTGGSAPAYAVSNNGDPESAVVYGADRVTSLTYAEPTAAGNKHAALFSALTSSQNFKGQAGVTVTLEPGEGRNNLSNASTELTLENPVNPKNPKGLPYIKIDASGMANFTGTVIAPFSIAKKSGNGFAIDATNAQADVVVVMPEGKTGTIDLTKFVVNGEETNGSGNPIAVDKSEIESIKIAGKDGQNAEKLFTTKVATISNAETIVPDFYTEKAEGDSFAYTVKDKAARTSDTATVELSYKLYNYGTAKTQDIKFTVLEDGGYSNTLKAALAKDEYEYSKSSAPKLEFTFTDGYQGSRGDSKNAFSDSTATAYFFSVGNNEAKTYIDKVEIEAGDINEDTGKVTKSAPASLKAIGNYCVIVVYKNTKTATPDTFTQAFDFSIVPVGSSAVFKTPTFNNASGQQGQNFSAGSLNFDPAGTIPGYKELTIAVGSDELNNTQYDITPVSEYEEKDVYTNIWSYTANETRIRALDGYSSATTNAMLTDKTGETYGDLFVKDADGKPILGYKYKADGNVLVPIFLDQPYVKISIKDTCTEYANVKPIYIVYEIVAQAATVTSAMQSLDKPEGTRTNIEIPLDGLLKVNGTTVYPNKYTVTLTGGTLNTNNNITSFTENPTKDGKIKFSIKDSTALTAANVMGKTVIFTVTPDMTGINTFTASATDITVTFKSSAELTTTLKGVTGNSVTYTSGDIVGDVSTSHTGTPDVTIKVMSGETDISSSFTGTSVIYKLAKETNNPEALDSLEGTTNQYEYDYDGDGVKDLYTKQSYVTSSLTNYSTIKDVGHYLVVTTASGTGYTDVKYEYPLEVTPFVINDSRATIDFDQDDADDKVTYKGTKYNNALNKTPNFIQDFKVKTLNPAIVMASDSATIAKRGTDYVATVGELTKGSTGEPAYYLPVEVIFKENDLDKVTDGKADPYINNYSGTITGKLEVTPTNAAFNASDLAIAFKPYDAFKYTGEVQKPELKSISYKGNAKTGTEAEILAAIKNAIDPDWAEVKLEWPGDDGCASDGKSAVTQTVTLKIGGLYDVSQTKTYSIAKEASTNIADAEEIIVDIAAAVGSTKVNLPLVFADKNDEEKTYEITGYTNATITGTSTATTSAAVSGNVLTITCASSNPTNGELLTAKAEATFAGYSNKEVVVKVRVRSAAYETKFSALAYSNSTFDNGPIEPSTALTIMEGSADVTTSGPTDGTVKYEWFKKGTGGIYESIGSEAPTHVGTYKVVVTLENAKVRYATPYESADVTISVLALTTTNASIDATDLENHVYDGKEHKAGIEITVKASALAGDEDLVLKESAEDPEFTINYGAAGANIYAGSVNLSTCTITGKTDGDYTFTIALSNLDAAKQTLVIGQKEVNLSLGNKSVVVDDTNTAAVKYADLSPEVTGLVEGDVVVSDNVDVEIVYARDENGNVIEIPENANLYKTPGTYTFRVNSLSAASIKNSATVPVEVGGSYKLAASRKSGTLTVSKPEKITPSITVSVNGTKITSDGKKFRTDETKDLLSVEVKNGSDILTKDTDYTVSITKDAAPATEVRLEGEYEVTVAPTSKYNFDSKTVKFTLEKAAEPVPTEEVTIKLYNTDNVGEEYATHSVARGMSVDKAILDNYVNSGATVEGWYKDAAFRKQWKFDTDVFNDDVTSLYAKTFYRGGNGDDDDYIIISMNGGYEYTGSKIVPTAVVKRVTNGVETVIKPSKKTYTVAYDTAVNACDDDKPYKATFTFYGDLEKLANESGKIERDFWIGQSWISDIKIAGNGTGLLLNAKYKPITSVKGHNKKTLKESEYKIKVYDPEGTEVATSNAKMTFDKEGTYKIEVTGDGANYNCDESDPWVIEIPVAAKAKHMKNAKVTIAAQKVTKADDFPVMPAISVKLPDGKTATIAKGETESTDGKVHVAYEYNDKVGKATAQIEADGFIGYINKTFQITANGTAVTAANIFTGGKETAKKIKALSIDYTGYGITLDKLAEDNELEIEDLINEKYIDSLLITYKNNIKAGTATMTIAGKPDSGLKGKFTQTFKINKVDFAKAFKDGMIEVYDFSAEENEGVIEITKAAFVKTNSRTGAITALNGPILYNAETRDFLTYKKDFTLVTKSGKTYLKGAGSYSLIKDALIEVKLLVKPE